MPIESFWPEPIKPLQKFSVSKRTHVRRATYYRGNARPAPMAGKRKQGYDPQSVWDNSSKRRNKGVPCLMYSRHGWAHADPCRPMQTFRLPRQAAAKGG